MSGDQGLCRWSEWDGTLEGAHGTHADVNKSVPKTCISFWCVEHFHGLYLKFIIIIQGHFFKFFKLVTFNISNVKSENADHGRKMVTQKYKPEEANVVHKNLMLLGKA